MKITITDDQGVVFAVHTINAHDAIRIAVNLGLPGVHPVTREAVLIEPYDEDAPPQAFLTDLKAALTGCMKGKLNDPAPDADTNHDMTRPEYVLTDEGLAHRAEPGALLFSVGDYVRDREQPDQKHRRIARFFSQSKGVYLLHLDDDLTLRPEQAFDVKLESEMNG